MTFYFTIIGGEEEDVNTKDDSLARWQVCPVKFGKILDFLGGICKDAGDLYEKYDVQVKR